jgi:hypothetical protein
MPTLDTGKNSRFELVKLGPKATVSLSVVTGNKG